MLSFTNSETVQYEQEVSSQDTYQTKQTLYGIGKRAFDLLIASMVTVLILAWLIPVLGILIKLSSPGPILFVQLRTGRNGRQFRCLKLRTMVHDTNPGFRQATKNDTRVTKIGRLLRKTNLDEIPQFINVLKGDMSIIGPRPHAIRHDAQYWTTLPNYKKRYLVKPGISGLAQTRGLRGESGLREMMHRVKLDLWYIRNQSLLLDIAICWWTVAKMFKGDEKAW